LPKPNGRYLATQPWQRDPDDMNSPASANRLKGGKMPAQGIALGISRKKVRCPERAQQRDR